MGGDPSRHRAVYLTPAVLRSVDLVLGMAREHRRAVVDLRPGLVRSSFTLTEFARLSAGLDVAELAEGAAAPGPGATVADRLRGVLGLLARARTRYPLSIDWSIDDVPDPIGRAAVDYEQSARIIEAAVIEVARVLTVVAPAQRTAAQRTEARRTAYFAADRPAVDIAEPRQDCCSQAVRL